VAEFHWDPGGYLALMREEVADYARLQDETEAVVALGGEHTLGGLAIRIR
jgi:hypothetical protein